MAEPDAQSLYFVARGMAPEHSAMWRQWGESTSNEEHVMVEGSVVSVFVKRKVQTTLPRCYRSLREFAARLKCPLPNRQQNWFQMISEIEFEMAKHNPHNLAEEVVVVAPEIVSLNASAEIEIVQCLPPNFDHLARAAWLKLVGTPSPVPAC